jgi:Arc/MetJ-type ribon-helix-helix transcriptional regulator
MSTGTSPAKYFKQRMAKKKPRGDSSQPGPGRPAIGKQVNVRLPGEIIQDLEYIYRGLGMDSSEVIRFILRRHLHTLVNEARESLERTEEERRKAGYPSLQREEKSEEGD